jgi:WD40 repeat protein
MLVSCSHDATIRTWNIENGEPISVYKTSGSVHCMRVGETDGFIQAIVNHNIFYEINPNSNSIVKCIKVLKHSITTFFYMD